MSGGGKDPLERGLEAAYAERSVLDVVSARTGTDARIRLRAEADGPALKPLGDADPAAGKYQLQGEIGRGGVGTVFKGFDTHLGRDVAIKLLRDDYLGNPDLLQRFVEEAQIGGQLQHPGIVPVYDLGLQGGRPFFSMKLVKGRTLAALLEERRDPGEGRRRLLAIFEQVCHTMAYAHARAVIHRDLKPANVMVGAFGEVQVVDWGMGKVLGKGGIADEARSRLSQQSVIATVRSRRDGSQSVVGSVMGTPAYMPPEQAMGDVERMDERSDVFALGAVLSEILTGKPPYVGEREEMIRMAAQADLAACHARLGACDADEELKALARQCLAPARQARPKHAGELADRIGRYITSVEARAARAQVEAAEERVKAHGARRSQKLTLGIAASVLLTLAVAGGGAWWWHGDRAARAERADRGAQAALDEARVAYGQAADAATWAAALETAKRADALARADEVTPVLRDAVARHLASVTHEQAKSEEQAARIRDELRALAVLEAIPIPPDDAGGASVDPCGEADSRRRDREYRAAFLESGIPVGDLTGSEAAARIRAMSRPELWVAALDDWARAALVLHGRGREHGHLLEVAMQADADPIRTDLRARADIEAAELRKVAEGELAPMTALLLAEMLGSRGDREGALAVLKAAQERHPDHVPTALRLAQRLSWSGDHQEALRFACVATSLRPESAGAARLKGAILRSVGKYQASLRCYERAGRRSQAVEEVRRLAAMEPRLEQIVRGEAEPADGAEARESAWLALRREALPRAAELFGKEADLAGDAADRDLADYNAVRMTARASAADSVSVAGQGGLRAQALTWLRASLAAAPDRQTLQRWLEDGDLAGLREPAELARLPAGERAAFESVWADVRRALGP